MANGRTHFLGCGRKKWRFARSPSAARIFSRGAVIPPWAAEFFSEHALRHFPQNGDTPRSVYGSRRLLIVVPQPPISMASAPGTMANTTSSLRARHCPLAMAGPASTRGLGVWQRYSPCAPMRRLQLEAIESCNIIYDWRRGHELGSSGHPTTLTMGSL